MGYFRFQRRLKLFPGGWTNLSERAVRSRSVSKRGVTGTAGLPGSGISDRTSPHHLGAQSGPQRRRSSRRPLSHSSARHGFWQQLRAIFFP
jgi:hypothetical protein